MMDQGQVLGPDLRLVDMCSVIQWDTRYVDMLLMNKMWTSTFYLLGLDSSLQHDCTIMCKLGFLILGFG